MSKNDAAVDRMMELFKSIASRRQQLHAGARKLLPGSRAMFEYVRESEEDIAKFVDGVRAVVEQLEKENPHPSDDLAAHFRGARGWLAREDANRPKIREVLREAEANLLRPTQALGVA